MIRIRYENTREEGIMRSVRNLHSKTTGAMYSVTLNIPESTYIIHNILSRRNYYGGENITNIHVLKRAVKSHLEKLGVEFGTEIRDVKEEK